QGGARRARYRTVPLHRRRFGRSRGRPQSGHRQRVWRPHRRCKDRRPSMSRLSRATRTVLVLFGAPVFFLTVFFLWPLANAVSVSFGLPTDLTFKAYQRLIDVPVYQAVYLRTVRIALIVTLLCVVIGYPCAYYVSRLGRRARTIVVGLIALP